MKRFLFLILTFYICRLVPAQLIITTGAQLYMQNNSQLTLENIDLINNGDFNAGNSTVFFTGSPLSNISGTSPLFFYSLSLNKAPNAILRLQRNINVMQNISFTTGLVDLNTFDIDLGTTGSLIGESETSRIIGNEGGQVLYSTLLNAPSSVNPANLGAIISSTKNMGNVIIRRGHQQQNNISGDLPGILRYYDIEPQFSAGLKLTLRFTYFDAELNGMEESGLELWKRDRRNWRNMGYSFRSAIENYVEKDNINNLSRFTLANETAELLTTYQTINSKLTDEQISKEEIYVWPNPFRDRVTITFNSLQATNVTFILFDVKGSIVNLQHNKLTAGINQLQINLPHLPGGVYTLQSIWANKTNKFIKLVKL